MPIFEIPITVVEYGRVAVIEADDRADAIRKMRACEWESLTDADRYKITKVGAVRELTREEVEGGKRGKWAWQS